MWNAVGLVGSYFPWAAFGIAIALYAYRAHLNSRINALKAIPAKDRAEALVKEVNSFGIDAKRMTREQQFTLAIGELKLRAMRLFLASTVMIIIAVISGGVAVYGPSNVQLSASAPTSPPLMVETKPALEAKPISPGPPPPPLNIPSEAKTTSPAAPVMLVTPAPDLAPEAKTVSPAPPLELTAATKALHRIYVSDALDSPEDRDVARGLRSGLERSGFQMADSAESAAVIVDVTNTRFNEWQGEGKNGLIFWYAKFHTNIATKWRANGRPLFPPPTFGKEEQDAGLYEARDKARAAMMEAAVRRFQVLTEK
jgi:hypothetical protein